MKKLPAILIHEAAKAIDGLRRRAMMYKNNEKHWNRWAKELSEKMNGMDAHLRQHDFLSRGQMEVIVVGLHLNHFEVPALLLDYAKTGKFPETKLRDALPFIRDAKATVAEIENDFFSFK